MTRQAVVLAAGRGRRFGAGTDDTPKPLLDLAGGGTLLGRQLAQFAARGVHRVKVVAGHHAEQVEHEAARAGGLEVRVAVNERFASTGSALSLLHAAAELEAGEPVLVTHGDIAYADEFLDRCLAGGGATVTAGDRTWDTHTGDEVLVWSRDGEAGGLVQGSGDGYDEVGEFVGVSVWSARFAAAFAGYCRERVAADPTLNYELPVLSEFMAMAPEPCRVEYLDHVPWVNVNYPADLAAARRWFGAPKGA